MFLSFESGERHKWLWSGTGLSNTPAQRGTKSTCLFHRVNRSFALSCMPCEDANSSNDHSYLHKEANSSNGHSYLHIPGVKRHHPLVVLLLQIPEINARVFTTTKYLLNIVFSATAGRRWPLHLDADVEARCRRHHLSVLPPRSISVHNL